MAKSSAPPPKPQPRTGSRTLRRYITRNEDGDAELAMKAGAGGSLLHHCWVESIGSDMVATEWSAFMAVAYLTDMGIARYGGTIDDLNPIYPEDVGDALGITQSMAARYLLHVANKGFIVGSANAGYRLRL